MKHKPSSSQNLAIEVFACETVSNSLVVLGSNQQRLMHNVLPVRAYIEQASWVREQMSQ